MQAQACTNFKNLMMNLLSSNNIVEDTKDCSCFVGPRRITFFAKNINAKVKSEAIERRGPKTSAPEQAVNGFLRSVGAKSIKNLSKTKIKGVEYYLFKSKSKEVSSKDVIQQELPSILQKMIGLWQNQMRWGEGKSSIKWIRPLQNILCLFNSKVIPITFLNVESNNLTYGHRFLANNKELKIDSIKDYLKKLEKNYIILDQNKREQIIRTEVNKLANKKKCKVLDGDMNFENPNSIISEAVGATEYPVALSGQIDDKFIDLPEKVLIDTIKMHQKYFCLKDGKGALSKNFIFIANIKGSEKNLINGNEKVLKARLNDAKFYIEEDLKFPLDSRLESLKKIVFHKKLGSVYDKVHRLTPLAKFITLWVPHSDLVLVERAVTLSKADLTTHGVDEIPELQGYLGGRYAQAQGENKKVCKAIEEQYMPVGQKDGLPKTELGTVLSISDKLDSIVGMFLIGEKPTSSRDPFALRRATLGIIRMIIENKLKLPLTIAINKSLNTFNHKLYKTNKKVTGESVKDQRKRVSKEVIEFFIDRLKIFLKDKGYKTDIINAVFYNDVQLNDKKFKFDIIKCENKIRQISEFVESKNVAILELYKRASNIVETEEKKIGEIIDDKPQSRLLREKQEKILFETLKEVKPKVLKLIKDGSYNEALMELSKLSTPLNNFFDKVMVNCKKESVKENRLELLSRIRNLFNKIIDFSKIEF